MFGATPSPPAPDSGSVARNAYTFARIAPDIDAAALADLQTRAVEIECQVTGSEMEAHGVGRPLQPIHRTSASLIFDVSGAQRYDVIAPNSMTTTHAPSAA